LRYSDFSQETRLNGRKKTRLPRGIIITPWDKQGKGARRAEQNALLQTLPELRKDVKTSESKGQAQHEMSCLRLHVFGENFHRQKNLIA
jgi:hypothetical protein